MLASLATRADQKLCSGYVEKRIGDKTSEETGLIRESHEPVAVSLELYLHV
jgi:hypothetical protein